jgi:hypothetical protein
MAPAQTPTTTRQLATSRLAALSTYRSASVAGWSRRDDGRTVIVNHRIVIHGKEPYESEGEDSTNGSQEENEPREDEEGRVREDSEDESKCDLELRVVFFHSTQSEGVLRDEVDGKMYDEGNDEEGQANEGGGGGEEEGEGDAESSGEGVRYRRVECGGERNTGERVVGKVGEAKGVVVGEEECLERGLFRVGFGIREEVDEPIGGTSVSGQRMMRSINVHLADFSELEDGQVGLVDPEHPPRHGSSVQRVPSTRSGQRTLADASKEGHTSLVR